MPTIREVLAIAAFCAAYHAPAPSVAQETGSVPTSDVEGLVEQRVESCIESNEGADFGRVTVADFCEIRAWSELGQLYPDLATVALEAEREAQQKAGRVNELHVTLDRREERIEVLSTRLGEQSAAMKRQNPKWLTTVLAAGAILVGGGIGYGVAKITH